MNRSPGDRTSAVDLGKYSLIRFKKGGSRFEIVVDPELAWLYRQGEEIAIEDIVEGFIIFDNFSKGLKANDVDLEENFQTTDERKIVEEIIKKGDLQLTQEQRKQFVAEKRQEIIDYLVKHAVNPKTKAPHPPDRLDKALDDAGVRIERKEPVSEQVERIMPQLERILPIKIESATIEFVVPPKDTGPLYGYIQSSGEVVNESWGSDGSLTMALRVPAGMVSTLLEEISDKSKGRVRSTVINRSE